jgi:hypothetical protein
MLNFSLKPRALRNLIVIRLKAICKIKIFILGKNKKNLLLSKPKACFPIMLIQYPGAVMIDIKIPWAGRNSPDLPEYA